MANGMLHWLFSSCHIPCSNLQVMCCSKGFGQAGTFQPCKLLLLGFKQKQLASDVCYSMVLWGIACVCCGLVHNFAGLATARWFLGLFEAGLFPGMTSQINQPSRPLTLTHFQDATSICRAGTSVPSLECALQSSSAPRRSPVPLAASSLLRSARWTALAANLAGLGSSSSRASSPS